MHSATLVCHMAMLNIWSLLFFLPDAISFPGHPFSPIENKMEEARIVESSCSKDLSDCVGYCKWSDGSIYEGEFRYGQPHGWGEMTWVDGSYYEGNFVNGFRQGKGTQLLSNGDQYIGYFKAGLMEGRGTYIWANGTAYTGEYNKDQIEGFGEIRFPDGTQYQGQWKDGLANGKGSFTLPGGAHFTGIFRKGKRHDTSKVVFADGAAMFSTWTNGSIQKAKAIIHFQNGDQIEAIWKNGLPANEITYQTATDGKPHTRQFTGLDELASALPPDQLAVLQLAIAIELRFDKQYRQAASRLEAALELLGEDSELYESVSDELASISMLLE